MVHMYDVTIMEDFIQMNHINSIRSLDKFATKFYDSLNRNDTIKETQKCWWNKTGVKNHRIKENSNHDIDRILYYYNFH